MKHVFIGSVFVASVALVGLFSLGTTPQPAMDLDGQCELEPVGGCPDVAAAEKLNKCTRQCSEQDKAAQKKCVDEGKACGRACKRGDGFKACRDKCREKNSKCAQDRYAAKERCVDACYASSGCQK